eukprot:5554852-Pyramimonas_sp.AAC.3
MPRTTSVATDMKLAGSMASAEAMLLSTGARCSCSALRRDITSHRLAKSISHGEIIHPRPNRSLTPASVSAPLKNTISGVLSASLLLLAQEDGGEQAREPRQAGLAHGAAQCVARLGRPGDARARARARRRRSCRWRRHRPGHGGGERCRPRGGGRACLVCPRCRRAQ